MSKITVEYKGVTVTTEESGFERRTTYFRIKEIVGAIDDASPKTAFEQGGVFNKSPQEVILDGSRIRVNLSGRSILDGQVKLTHDAFQKLTDWFNDDSVTLGHNKAEQPVKPEINVGDYVIFKYPKPGEEGLTFEVLGAVRYKVKLKGPNEEFRYVNPQELLTVVHKPKKEPKTHLTTFVEFCKESRIDIKVIDNREEIMVLTDGSFNILLGTFTLDGALKVPVLHNA